MWQGMSVLQSLCINSHDIVYNILSVQGVLTSLYLGHSIVVLDSN